MRILSSIRDDARGQLVITVWLDESKTLADGSPDPAWVADPYAWSLQQTAAEVIDDADQTGETMKPNPAYIPYDEWLASVVTETRLLAEQELARRLALLDPPTDAGESGGTELGLQF